MDKMQNLILRKLKKATEVHGSLKSISEKTGISTSYLSRIKSGKIKLSLGMMEFWKRYFKI